MGSVKDIRTSQLPLNPLLRTEAESLRKWKKFVGGGGWALGKELSGCGGGWHAHTVLVAGMIGARWHRSSRPAPVRPVQYPEPMIATHRKLGQGDLCDTPPAGYNPFSK